MNPSDLARAIECLSTRRRVLLTTHVRPDGDAIGSCAAMALAMKSRGIPADILLLSHLPRKYAFIFQDAGVAHRDVEKGWPADFDLGAYDGLVVVDTGTWSQLPGFKERLEARPVYTIIIDHHMTQESWGECRIADPSAAAAGELVAQVIEAWGIAIDPPLASALFAAVASDTGWFQFSNTRPQTLRLAADLMEKGADTERLYQALYQNEKPQRVALLGRAVQSMELLAEGRLAVMRIRAADFAASHADVPDTENLINVPLQVASVQVSMLITESIGPGPTRISLRSKGQVDVAKFAERFGGGGHKRASGLKIDAAFDVAADRVVAAMVKELA